jgi:hypothetical protein
MARKDRLTAVLATEKPGLEVWLETQDAELDAAREAQVRLADKGRWEGLVAGTTDDTFMREGVLGPLADVMTEHARSEFWPELRRRGSRRRKDPNVRFHDEIDAIRFWWASQAEQRSGDFDRIAQRIALGATIQTSTRNTEPTSDAHLDAVERAIAVVGDDFQLLRWAHLEFLGPRQRTAKDLVREDFERKHAAWERDAENPERGPEPTWLEHPIYLTVPRRIAEELWAYDEQQTDTQMRARFETFARWLRDGRKIKKDEETVELYDQATEITQPAVGAMSLAVSIRQEGVRLPRGSKLTGSDDLRWFHLVAERLEMNISGALGPLDPKKDPAADGDCRMTWLEASSREVRARYSAARKKLRDALWRTCLDVRPAFLIPAPTSRELDVEADDGSRLAVECCAGFSVFDGVRRPCRSRQVDGPAHRHPARMWPRCDVCRKPIDPRTP